MKIESHPLRKVALLVALTLIIGAAPAPPVLAAPPAPQWLPGQPMLAGTQIIAMWLPVIGAVKYIVYLNGQKAMESPANQFIGAAPDKGGEYSYTISAVDSSGAEGPQSPPGVVRIVLMEPPQEPIFRIEQEERNVLIRWNKPAGSTIFNLYKAEAENGPWNLITSTQEDTYKDTNLEYGKPYFYAVSAKDMTGKESERGKAGKVLVEKPKIVVKSQANSLNIIPTREVDGIDFFGPFEVAAMGGLWRSPSGRLLAYIDGNLILLTDNLKVDTAYIIDREAVYENVKQVNVARPKELTNPLMLTYINFIDDRTLIACDNGNKVVLVLDLDKGAFTWVSKPLRTPTREEDPKVWEAIDPSVRGADMGPSGAVRLPNGDYWVCDSSTNVWIVLSPKGDIKGWFSTMLVGDRSSPDEMPLRNAPYITLLKDGTLLMFVPLSRAFFRIDPKDRYQIYTIGRSPTWVGNFLGWGGASLTSRGGEVMQSDGAMAHVQVFDTETGAYLYSMGGPEGKPNPEYPTSPLIDFPAPRYPILDQDGKRFLIVPGAKNYLSVRELLKPLPPPPQSAKKE